MLEKIFELSLSNPLLPTLGISLVRSFAGWAEHAFKDGNITMPELLQLITTFLRFVPQAIGLGALGLPMEASLITDVFLTKVAKMAEK